MTGFPTLSCISPRETLPFISLKPDNGEPLRRSFSLLAIIGSLIYLWRGVYVQRSIDFVENDSPFLSVDTLLAALLFKKMKATFMNEYAVSNNTRLVGLRQQQHKAAATSCSRYIQLLFRTSQANILCFQNSLLIAFYLLDT